MKRARLMDRPADFKKFGINPSEVEVWEDGRRDDGRKGSFEWWYFDALLDDGTKLVMSFFPKIQQKIRKSGDYPFCRLAITTPDGVAHTEDFTYDAAEASFSKEKCDIVIGPHRVTGDLRNYSISISPVNGLGADLKLASKSTPWRPGTAYFAFGDHDEKYFTWLCVVPRGEISGTITIDGTPRAVKGFGYHDHQWGNILHMFAWNQWIWARENFGDYNLVLFDLVTNQKFGYLHFPLCFLEDASGNLILENTGGVALEVLEEYYEKETAKSYPRRFRYTIDSDKKTLEYTVEVRDEIEIVNYFAKLKFYAKWLMTAKGLRPTYIRYEGTGEMRLTEDGVAVERKSNFIYEMLYAGKKYIKDKK